MLDFITQLFDTSGFPERWHCGHWTELHGWIHIISDTAIFGAYAAIPLSIGYYLLRKQRDVQFPKLYWLFAAFIFSCGFGHLVEASIFWHPWYRFSALVKVITACVSWLTVLCLIRYIPEAMQLPGALKLSHQFQAEVEERKKAQQEIARLNADLKRRLSELETLLEVLPVGIGLATDPSCRSIRTNPAFARMLKLSPEQNPSLSAPAGEAPTHYRILQNGRELKPEELPIQMAASRQMMIRDFEEEFVFEDGEHRHVLVSAAPLYEEGGAIRGAVGAFVDITDRRRAARERERVQQRLQETQRLESLAVLAGGVAHDFNNLLTAMLGNAELARMELEDNTPVRDRLEQIEIASLRAGELCNQMLACAGRGRFVSEPLHLSDAVREIKGLIDSTVGRKAEVEFALADELPTTLADPSQIRQVIMNLIINATEATGERDGKIQIKTGTAVLSDDQLAQAALVPQKRQPQYVLLEIQDNGCGMDEATQRKMFDPFFSTKFTGRGLGLAATLGIVRSHDGAIIVRFKPGQGTSFQIFFPASDRLVQRSLFDTQSGLPKPGRTSGTVLIVDDEDAVRELYTIQLSRAGYEILTARDGIEALEIYPTHRAEIVAVVLDLTMPRMDGHRTFELLRDLSPSLPIVLTSGYTREESYVKFTRQTPDAFIKKPHRQETLLAALRQVISKNTEPARR